MSYEDQPDELNPYQPPEAHGPDEEPDGSATGAVTGRFMRLLGEDGGVLTQIYVVIAVFNLGIMAISAAIQYRVGVVPSSLEIFSDPTVMEQYTQQPQFSLLGLLVYPLSWISCALYYAGFRPMRLIEAGQGADLDLAGARREMFSNFAPIMAAVFFYLVAVSLGTACCVLPGVIASVVLLPAAYLVAARGAGVFASLSTAIDWTARHWLLLAVAGVAILLVSLVMVVLSVVVTPTFSGLMGDVGIFAGSAVMWLLGSIIGYFAWVLVGSILITIDLAEEQYYAR